MDELKVILFMETLYNYRCLTESCGTESDEWIPTQAKFSVLYGIIEKVGLEGEYQEWKKRILEGEYQEWNERILEGEGGETDEVDREDQSDGRG